MSARRLTGREPAAAWRADITERVAGLAASGRQVGLATLLVGDDGPSDVYVAMKHKAAVDVGMVSMDHRLGQDATQYEVEEMIDRLNEDEQVTGYIVQLPLPPQIDSDAAILRIDPAKDADGLHPVNLGRMVMELPAARPATPLGILRMLTYYEIETAGKRVVIVGRSGLVGRPLSVLLNQRPYNATVTVTHSATTELPAVTRSAEILVVAAGSPGLIGADHVAPGAVVIDVGTTSTDSGLTGDVRFDEVSEVAAAVSPVPGGVGPMTISGLLANTVMLAEMSMEEAG